MQFKLTALRFQTAVYHTGKSDSKHRPLHILRNQSYLALPKFFAPCPTLPHSSTMKCSFPCSGQEEIFNSILLSSGAPQPERINGAPADLGCSQALSLVGTNAVLHAHVVSIALRNSSTERLKHTDTHI